MKKKTSSQSLYVIFGVVIALLIALIGYFVYLLVSPSQKNDQANTNQTVNTNTVNPKTTKKKKANSNTATDTPTVVNDNTNPTDTTTTVTDEGEVGLVEPKPDDTATDDTAADETTEVAEVVAGEGEQIVTLYFPKTDSACGEVFPVQRAVTPEEDLYGQILLADMVGPSAAESGYTSAMPSGLRLRRVEYTGTGPVIYVNEAFAEARDCDQQTAEAQLVETANAMFDFPEGTSGEVIVGYPDDALQP